MNSLRQTPKSPSSHRRRTRLLIILALAAAVTMTLMICSLPTLLWGLAHWYTREYVPFEETGLPQPSEFLITSAEMPPGWEREFGLYERRYPEVYLGDVPVEAAVSFANDQKNAHVSHTIGADTAPERAEKTYYDEVAYRGQLLDDLPAWTPLGDWDYRSPIADRYALWIVERNTGSDYDLVVMVVAQYDHYVSQLWLEGRSDLVNPQEIRQLIIAADNRFADSDVTNGQQGQ